MLSPPPAYSYFKEKLDTDLKEAVKPFKAACYFLPSKIDELRPTISDIDSLKSFPFLDSTILPELKAELADYIAAAGGVVGSVNPLDWWKAKEENNSLLKWAQAFKLVLLVQPSSGAAKHVFSVLNNSFNTRQESAMEDYIELFSNDAIQQ